MIRICYQWGDAAIRWNKANWTWDECQLVAECITWGNAGVLWRNANWLWSQCTSSVVPPTPVSPFVIQPLGVDATTLIQPWLIEPWNPYRAGEREDNRKKWIKLICKVKNIEYVEEKMAKDFDINIDDVKLAVKKISGIELDIK